MLHIKTKIMGVLNVTGDSFYPPSRALDPEDAIERALVLQEEGADIIDIGGESTRPGACQLSVKTELDRVLPVLKGLKGRLRVPISIDTMKPEVAEMALNEGARLINDVGGFRDPLMRKLAAKTKADVCVMHMLGVPGTMQRQIVYERGVIVETLDWLDKQTKLLQHEGVEASRIIVDPGIGFGKTMSDNIEILRHCQEYRKLGFRILVGISRKSFMARYLRRVSEDLLPATIALNSFLALSGIDIIRVHDVRAHRDALDMLNALGFHDLSGPQEQKS